MKWFIEAVKDGIIDAFVSRKRIIGLLLNIDRDYTVYPSENSSNLWECHDNTRWSTYRKAMRHTKDNKLPVKVSWYWDDDKQKEIFVRHYLKGHEPEKK